MGRYIFEKKNASDKDCVNDSENRNVKNAILYDFKAYKGYFIFGNYLVALGAGIKNYKLELEGSISFEVSTPCAVLIREERDCYIVTMTDACMASLLKGITLRFNGQVIGVPVPQGELEGKPSVVVCKKS